MDFNLKYIIIYIDQDIDKKHNIINNIIKIINIDISIIILLSNNEDKYYNSKTILEIYPDNYTEENLVSNSLFIIYISEFKKSNNLIEIIKKYNKIIFYKKENIINDINLFFNNNNIDETQQLDFIDYYHNLKQIIQINYNKNIKIELNKKINNIKKDINDIDKLFIVTFYKNFIDNNIINTIQKTCITQNIKNKNINKILIIGKDLKNSLENILENEMNKIILYDFSEENISFSKLINITNNIFFNKTVCLLRSDIVIPNQENIDFMEINIKLSQKKIFLIPRLDRCINSKIIKSPKLSNSLFSTEQDAFLFKTPLLLNNELNKNLEEIYFYNKYEHLCFNKILIKNNYYIENNPIFKILRIMSDNNIDKRELLFEKNIENNNLNNFFLLPDFDIINKLQFEDLIKISNIDENEVYKMKCYFFNKYLKNKIMNNI